jgi:RNA ligase (TIGR02306 family)
MTSTFKVPLTKIVNILPHPNADRLEIAVVYGFEVVVKKDSYKVGDEVIYIPIDSILPNKLEQHLFPADAKIKLHRSRVRQIRIRKHASQGMLISIDDIRTVYGINPLVEDKDYKEEFEITKYEPPIRGAKFGSNTKVKRLENPHFKKYNGVNNIKWFPNKFQEGQIVEFQEKIHGTNVRFGKVPFVANTLWKKIKKFFGLVPKFEFCYGSNNVQLQDRTRYKGYYGEDLYGATLKDYSAEALVEDGEIVYGEIYGGGIQKNYNYGCEEGEYKMVIFDVKVLQPDGTFKWLNPVEVRRYARDRGFEMVPTLYKGPFSMGLAKEYTQGDSVLCYKQKVREGIVVKDLEQYDKGGEKQCLKVISEKYLDKDQSDFH